MKQVNKVDQEKYSASLQKFLGYNKEEADYVACDYNLKHAKGIEEPLRCPVEPEINWNQIGPHGPNLKFTIHMGKNINKEK